MWYVIGYTCKYGWSENSMRLFAREIDANAYAALIKVTDFDSVKVNYRDIL